MQIMAHRNSLFLLLGIFCVSLLPAVLGGKIKLLAFKGPHAGFVGLKVRTPKLLGLKHGLLGGGHSLGGGFGGGIGGGVGFGGGSSGYEHHEYHHESHHESHYGGGSYGGGSYGGGLWGK
ncbi:pupal cuticle protein Edg-91 [Drosophila tropicalis]|uniref:pupal cuticle protein Edg-91 n=1 Tax=Drosophila tropicalis TaxID=46794 RepID=UPI0035AB8584